MSKHGVEEIQFEEKDRIHGVFSEIAQSLSEEFFTAKETDAIAPTQGDVLQHVLDYTRKRLDAEKCALFLVDSSGKSLVLERASGVADSKKLKDVATYDLEATEQAGTGVTPWVLQRKKSFNAKTYDELRHNSEGHWKGNWDVAMYGEDKVRTEFKCVYMVPLLAGDRRIGVLKYENRTGDKQFFDKTDERLIDTISALVTNLVISQRIERNRYDRILPAISSALVSHFDKPSFYEELLEKCRHILDAELCSLFLLDDEDNLDLKCIVGLDRSKREQLRDFGYKRYKWAKGLTPWILKRGKSFNVRSYPDLRGRSEGNHKGRWDRIVYDGKPEKNFRSLYSIPLIIGEKPIGVFKVENKKAAPYYFTESDERLFDLIGRLIALVSVKYERARENEEYLARMGRVVEWGFLAAGVAHEFNNYLQTFLVMTHNALEEFPDDTARERLKAIVSEIEKAAESIDNFRTVMTKPRIADTFDLDGLAKRIIAASQARFDTHDVTMTYKNEGVVDVRLNESETQTIIINLVNNAFESVADRQRPRIVEVLVRLAQDENVVIEVIDSGREITKTETRSIFAPFYTTKPGGMGVGLYWVHRLVDKIGGTIAIDSPNQHEGATFRVTLPQGIWEESVR